MKMSALSFRIAFLSVVLCCASLIATAQMNGLRGQIYLPNGSPIQKVTRFTLTTDNGMRTEIYFTDSNGRISVLPAPAGLYKITVESDGETYETTSAQFDAKYAGNQVIVTLLPLKAKTPALPPGEINVNEVDKKVSPKARESYNAALALIQTNQLQQAIAPLKQAISLQKDYFQAHNDLGVVYMKLDKLPEAEEMLRQAIKLNDKVYLPQLNLGVVLNKQSNFKEATEVLVKLQRRYPDLTKVHVPLVEALIGSQDWAGAEAEIKKALTLADADQVDLKVKMGMVEIRQGKFEPAIVVLREAIKAEPDNALAQFNLGVALIQTANLDEAETALSKTYALKGSEMAGAQLMLGQVYFQKQNYAKAIESFEIYLRDLPNAPNAAQVKDAVEKLRQSVKKP
jgi:tetratricopeptide (TPR) repeat protein